MRKVSRLKRRVTSLLAIALVISGIGYVGHMDEQDLRAKSEGHEVYFKP